MAVKIDLVSLAKRPRGKRSVAFRDIVPPAMYATDLYRALYAPVVALITTYAARINAEYERALSAMTTDSAADLGAILSELASEMSRLVLELRPALREWVLRVEQWQRGKWRGAVLSATGVDLGTVMNANDATQTLEQVLAWNVDLVTNVSDQARQRIANAVFAGLQNRTPAREVAKEISEAIGMGRDRSRRIAADQLTKLSAQLADERRREAGLSTWEWVHSRKRHPRSEHVARDGDYYSDDSAMVGRTVDGKRVMAPPEEKDRPGRPPYCGCRSRSVIVWEDD